jgi:hypothetical protein
VENYSHQVHITFQQNWSNQEVIHYVLRSTNLAVFQTMKNCHGNGSNLLLYIPA